MIELGMPEVGAVQVERALAEGEQVPRVAGQVNVHQLLRHDALGRVDDGGAILLVADALDLGQVAVRAGL